MPRCSFRIAAIRASSSILLVEALVSGTNWTLFQRRCVFSAVAKFLELGPKKLD
jgi:hypothetical protein